MARSLGHALWHRLHCVHSAAFSRIDSGFADACDFLRAGITARATRTATSPAFFRIKDQDAFLPPVCKIHNDGISRVIGPVGETHAIFIGSCNEGRTSSRGFGKRIGPDALFVNDNHIRYSAPDIPECQDIGPMILARGEYGSRQWMSSRYRLLRHDRLCFPGQGNR